MHYRQCAGRERNLAFAARHAQPMSDVVLGLRAAERGEMVLGGHPLRELPQLAAGQHLLQLRLAHEHDLDQLLGVRLQVRDEPDLLEHLGREVLGLVDEEHDVAALLPRLEQESVQRVDVVLERAAGDGDVQVLEGRAQQLGRGERRIEHEGSGGARVEPREEIARERRLARSHLTGDEDESAPLAPAELQVGEGLRVALGQVEVLGVRGEVEGLLREPVVGLVHGPTSPAPLRRRRGCARGPPPARSRTRRPPACAPLLPLLAG